MPRKSVWLFFAVVFGTASCGGSREPLFETKGNSGAAGGTKPRSNGGAGTGGIAGSVTEAVAGALVETCSGLGTAMPEANATDRDAFSNLRDTGAEIGVAVSANQLSSTEYVAIAAREFNALTPENEMKWDTIEPNPGQFEFTAADRLVRFAEEHQMKVRGHTLVWHSQLPYWVTQLTGADAVRQAMKRHIETVMAHYRENFPGRVVAWDVVNEALDSMEGVVSYRDSPFYRELGEGFIAEAFRIAHALDPDALLFYNDYGIEGMGAKATATFEMLRSLVAEGVPISGVGFQMHTRAWNRGPTIADFTQNLARYAEIGLPVNISEMDASICDAVGNLEERLEQQRLRYNAIAAACFQSNNCKSITVWGVTDGNSWLNSGTPCEDEAFTPSPLLFDATFRRKPAWVGLRDALLGCYY